MGKALPSISHEERVQSHDLILLLLSHLIPSYHTRCGDLVGPNCGASASDVGGPGTEARPSNRRLPLPIRSDSSNSNGNGKEEWSSAITGGPNSSASRSRDQLKKLKRTSLTG